MLSKVSLLCLATASLGLGARVAPRGDAPAYPYDPNTSKYCDYWVDITSANTKCSSLPGQWGISLADFLRWNPSLAPDCSALTVGQSYCVETYGEPSPTDGGPSGSPTPTGPGNGITTPQPTQPSMVDNCDAFYFVQTDDSCDAIAASHGITLNQFLTWNPKAGPTCTGLWASTYACVSVIDNGGATTTTTAKPTTTAPGNGISTPQPTQPSMVDNCDAFYFVQADDSCDTIAASHGISLQQFITWNPKAGATCTGLWANAYACVSIIGQSPGSTTTTTAKPTTTTPGNGISTPQPTQPSMVANCDAFYFVQADDSCDTIAASHGITLQQFITWNPKAGATCTGLWANAYACVSIVGQAPVTTTTTTAKTTTTTAGNGISTPQPTQPSMVANCDLFYFVKADDSCDGIAASHGITVQQFTTWNPKAGATCTGLWANAYACISIVGHTPGKPSTTTTLKTTTTTKGNGISTPTPTQPGMVGNCKKFYLVKSGDTCAAIASQFKVTVANLISWNTGAGSSCNLWATTYACVGV
ncbi:carbohydrate-binding module family 50 protein [Nemania sp. NC0429]|nr:carbohydrate-binding module family 50 protein [Nemania sp. NC0429]